MKLAQPLLILMLQLAQRQNKQKYRTINYISTRHQLAAHYQMSKKIFAVEIDLSGRLLERARSKNGSI